METWVRIGPHYPVAMLVAKGDNKQDGPDDTAKTEGVISYRSRCGFLLKEHDICLNY
jgi:hypothetical protein